MGRFTSTVCGLLCAGVAFVSAGEVQDINLLSVDYGGSWRVRNDSVMGGVSESQVSVSDDRVVKFWGTVRTENNGGFASVRRMLNPGGLDLSSAQSIILEFTTDRAMKVDLIMDDGIAGRYYTTTLQTTGPGAQTFEVGQDSDWECGWPGMNCHGLHWDRIQELGFQIGDKQVGDFEMSVRRFYASGVDKSAAGAAVMQVSGGSAEGNHIKIDGYCLTNYNDHEVNWNTVALWECADQWNDRQLWTLFDDGSIRQADNTRFCLTNRLDQLHDGNTVYLWECDMRQWEWMQRWQVSSEGHITLLRSGGSDWCLSILDPHGRPTNNHDVNRNMVDLWHCNADMAAQQQWEMDFMGASVDMGNPPVISGADAPYPVPVPVPAGLGGGHGGLGHAPAPALISPSGTGHHDDEDEDGDSLISILGLVFGIVGLLGAGVSAALYWRYRGGRQGGDAERGVMLAQPVPTGSAAVPMVADGVAMGTPMPPAMSTAFVAMPNPHKQVESFGAGSSGPSP